MDLTLTHQRLPGVTVIGVRGELDLLNCGRFEEFLETMPSEGDQLVIDLARTTFIDCAGLRALVHAHDRAREGGGVLRLAALRPLPARVIRLAGLDTVLVMHPSLRHAISATFNPVSPDAQVQSL